MPALHSHHLTKIDQLVAVGHTEKIIYIYIINWLNYVWITLAFLPYLLGYILPMSIKDSCSAHLGISGHILPLREIPWTEGPDRL